MLSQLLEVALFILSISIYVIKFKEYNKNQHILSVLLFVLQIGVLVDVIGRVTAWYWQYTTEVVEGNVLYGEFVFQVAAIIDRVINSFWVFWEVLIMSFLCKIL